MKKLGFGCMRLPVHGESKDFMSAEDIDLEQLFQMVDTFMERGFTYFDTSYVYHNGKSELAIEEALVKRYPRDSFLLADKLPTFSITRSEQLPAIFEEQRELGLDVNVELNYYRPLKRRQHSGDRCDRCGKCSAVCPMGLDVMEELKRTSDFQDRHGFW